MRPIRSIGTVNTIAFCTACFLCAAAVAPRPARGQFAQYTQPGTVSRGGPSVTRAGFETALAEAPWHLGPVRVDPWIGLRNVSWSANPLGASEEGSPKSDLLASGGAGVRAHLPTGHNLFWTVHALPEYSWWAREHDRNRLNGRYGAGLFGFFNRVTLEMSARRQEQLGVVSAEQPQEVNSRRDIFTLATETRLGFATSVFAEATETRIRNVLNRAELAAAGGLRGLDRNEGRLRGGLRYRPRERWTLGAGVEWTESDSTDTARDLSSRGTAPLVEVVYSGPKFWTSANAELRSLRARPGSEFKNTDTETYSVQLGVDGNRLSPAVYARRSLSLSVSENYSHYTTDTFGASVAMTLGYRTQLRAFGELGTADFAALDPAVPARMDDITSYGIDLNVRLSRRLNAHLGGYHTRFDSNLPGEDRVLDVLQTGVSLGFGRSGSEWL